MFSMFSGAAAARDELRSIVRKDKYQLWNPLEVGVCIAISVALFAHVSYFLSFHLRHRQPVRAWLLGPGVGAVVAVALVFLARSRLRRVLPARAALATAVCAILAVLLGVLGGDADYRWYSFGYYSYFDLATYINIDPSVDKGQSYMDAGQVYFKDSSHVLKEQAIAFQHSGVYCVAPIVREPVAPGQVQSGCQPGCVAPECQAGSPENGGQALVNGGTCIKRCSQRYGDVRYCGEGAAYEQGDSYDCSGCDTSTLEGSSGMRAPSGSGTIDFWAVGKDCCEPSGAGYSCGAVNSSLARAGMRLLRDDLRPYYLMAVQEWSARTGVPARHPLFFHWVEDPISEVDSYMQSAEASFWLHLLWFLGLSSGVAFFSIWITKLAGVP
eukprot:TRINITY_DN18059_c0_g1_i1.p1 TRINITY_DN18059_c0_g1~~TRINITY_DN18059_c0_g1_i1.p1  ORF type:complete len:398 (+),score=56.77 TRINITY_DN18059_c0_g1_i1:46-1194(+)